MSNVSLTYLKTAWTHNFRDEPVEIWCELTFDRIEVRVVEIFADGRIGFASRASSSGSTRLSESPIPSVDEIAMDPQFKPVVVTCSEFEATWSKANSG